MLARSAGRALAGTAPIPRPLAECVTTAPAHPGGATGRLGAAAPTGAWWHQAPVVDAAGTLDGWTLVVGAPGGREITLTLPAASVVTGPVNGQVFVATDDGNSSAVRVVDATAGCARTVDIAQAIARRAIADLDGAGILVHLLDRDTRDDLGVWRIGAGGVDHERVLAPIPEATLRAAGIEQVWATALATSGDGSRLAVQSCAPENCVTRVLEFGTGSVMTVDGAQGELVGFASDRLVTMGPCPGLPCSVLAWSLENVAPSTLEEAATGAAMAPGGVLIAAVVDSDGRTRAIAIDPSTGTHRSLGFIGSGTVPAGGASASAGIETAPGTVGLLGPDGRPALLDLDPSSSPATRQSEVQP